jgi:NAD(P)-dependent dehydrogenase (short-subunit alcohol dehydrogenase family)
VTAPLKHDEQSVAIVTGASTGIGAGLVTGYRERGYAVVATARSIRESDDPGIVTMRGDISDPATAQRIVDEAVERFGRIDTLITTRGSTSASPSRSTRSRTSTP